LATVFRVLSTRSFTAPVVLLAAERCPPELRLLLEGLRAPPDDARFDRGRLLRDAAVREPELDEPDRLPDEPDRVPERGLALAPFVLRPDELRRPVEPLFCPDFELPWAILASLILGLWVGSVGQSVYESVLPTRSTSSASRWTSSLTCLLVLPTLLLNLPICLTTP